MSIEIDKEKIMYGLANQDNVSDASEKLILDSTNYKKSYYCEEEDLLDVIDDDFSYQIKERGEDYYDSGNVIFVSKNDNKYYAKVDGSDIEPYVVHVDINKDGVEYDCTCPCDFPCKHEYAVLMAITNQKYSNIELKPEIKEKSDSLQSILKQIPADEIKEYLLSPKGMDYVCFEMETFEEHFRKYYPNQAYEYYYNNLFNALILDDEYEKMVYSYINRIRQYISSKDFKEGFKVFRSIISAYNDTNKLNFDDYIIKQFPTLGMLIRIISRKCDDALKAEMQNWITYLGEENYYDNLYLEDIILMISFGKEVTRI